jgi:thimet oligopeptidase
MIDPAELPRRTAEALEQARARLAAFAARPAGGAAAQALVEFDRIDAPLHGPRGWVDLFESVHPDAEVRAQCEAASRELQRFQTEFGLHRGAYEALARIAPEDLGDAGARRLLERGLRQFRRAGVDRDGPTRARIATLRGELVELGQAFARHIVEDTREFVVEDGHRALAGLPEDFLRSHPERPDGSVVLSTDPTDRVPVLTFADSDALRRAYFLLDQQRALPANVPVLAELLRKRHELARLLGAADWADYATEELMTGSGAQVAAFLDRLEPLLREPAERDADQLLALAREVHPDWRQVPEWARHYWSERLRARRGGAQARELRPYLAFGAVRDGLLALVSELFQLEIVALPAAPRWHGDVELYQLRRGAQVLGEFALDLHPRPGKFKHAAMFPLHHGGPEGDLPRGAIVANLPRPTAGDAALLLHDDVVTLFHEFGHLLHFLLGGRQPFHAFAGGEGVEWDFVEVPSQLFEEWASDAAVLQRFARHESSGEPLPAALVERLHRSQRVCRALDARVQLFYARLALDLHRSDPQQLDPLRMMIETKQRLLPIPHTEGNYFHLTFGHLVGYSAAYYTYAWSLVIAKDLLGRFEGRLLEAEPMGEYAAKVLEPGSSRAAAQMVEDFLGRPYAFERFERWLREGEAVA